MRRSRSRLVLLLGAAADALGLFAQALARPGQVAGDVLVDGAEVGEGEARGAASRGPFAARLPRARRRCRAAASAGTIRSAGGHPAGGDVADEGGAALLVQVGRRGGRRGRGCRRPIPSTVSPPDSGLTFSAGTGTIWPQRYSICRRRGGRRWPGAWRGRSGGGRRARGRRPRGRASAATSAPVAAAWSRWMWVSSERPRPLVADRLQHRLAARTPGRGRPAPRRPPSSRSRADGRGA